MSSKKYQYFRGAESAPADRRERIGQILSKVYELCGKNDSEVARRIGVSQPRWQYWRKGQHLPDDANIEKIRRLFKISFGEHGEIVESAADYSKPLDKDRQELLDTIGELVKDPETEQDIIDHLQKQVNFLRRVPRNPKKRA